MFTKKFFISSVKNFCCANKTKIWVMHFKLQISLFTGCSKKFTRTKRKFFLALCYLNFFLEGLREVFFESCWNFRTPYILHKITNNTKNLPFPSTSTESAHTQARNSLKRLLASSFWTGKKNQATKNIDLKAAQLALNTQLAEVATNWGCTTLFEHRRKLRLFDQLSFASFALTCRSCLFFVRM